MTTLRRQSTEPTIAHRCKSAGCMRPVTWRVADTKWWRQHEHGVEHPAGITFVCCERHVETAWPVRSRQREK